MEASRSQPVKSDSETPSATDTPNARFLTKFPRMLKHLKDIQVYKRCVMKDIVPYGRELADRMREEGVDLPKVKGGMAQLPSEQKVTIIETHLENYANIFSATEKNPAKHKNHIKYFKDQLYAPHKKELLRGPEDTEWLHEGDIVIKYDPDSKNAMNRKVCIRISAIYRDATAAAKFKEEDLNRKKAPEDEWMKANELNFPEGMLLYIYRLSIECEDNEEDRKRLDAHIKVLEKELRITQDATPATDDNALGQFISRMTRGRKDMPKVDVPGGSNALVEGIVGTINRNPQLENIVKGVLDGVDFNGSAENLFASLAVNITDPNLVGRVQEAAKTFDPNTLPESLKKAIPMPEKPPMAVPPDPFAKPSATQTPAPAQQSSPTPAPAAGNGTAQPSTNGTAHQ